ncbi:hypothetical protein HpCK38_19930 [Helicobacter pylori]
MFIRVLTLSSLLSILVFADQYATSVKPLFADNSSTKVIGKLLPTAEVEVIKKEGSRALISISGFQDGNKPAIYFVAGKRILNAGFDGKAGVKFLKIGEEVVDKKVYSKVKVEVWTEDSDFTSDLKALYTKANDLFSQNCSMCHGLHQQKNSVQINGQVCLSQWQEEQELIRKIINLSLSICKNTQKICKRRRYENN